MIDNIVHIGGNKSHLDQLLENELEIPYQLPEILSFRFDKVVVLHDNEGAMILSVKDNITHITRPVGKYSSEFIPDAFINGLIKDKVYLDGWSEGKALNSCLTELFMGMDSARITDGNYLIFLYHDPRMFPENLSGKRYQSLRTAMNRFASNDAYIRQLDESDMHQVRELTDIWFKRKIRSGSFPDTGIDLRSLPLYKEALSIFDPAFTGMDYEVYGLFTKDHKLAGFQNHVRIKNKVVPISRISRHDLGVSEECMDIYMLNHWRDSGIDCVFRGAKHHQPKSLHWYNTKFCEQYEIMTMRYVLSSVE